MLTLGWPLILTNLAQVAIMTTDVVMMGWLGPSALAAGVLGTNLYFAVFVLGMGLAHATSPMVAQALGRNRHSVRDVRRTVRQGFWVTAAYSMLAWAVLWHGGAILAAMGQDPDLATQAGLYLRALMWGVLPSLWFMVLRNFQAALERPRAGMVMTVLAVGVNAFCNWVLMFGNLGAPALGVVGSGVASTLSAAFMFAGLLGFSYWDRRIRRYHLLGRFWRADGPRLRDFLRVGMPIGVTMACESTVFNATAFLMGAFGAQALAAHGIALQVAAITFMVPLGLSQAATVRVGLAAGRRDANAAGRAGWTAIALGIGFMAMTAVLFLTAPRPIIGLFLDLGDPANAEVVGLAVLLVGLAGVFQVVDGGQVMGAGALRGLKDTRVPMLFAAFGYWAAGLPVGVVLAFPLGLGPAGLWIGLATGLGVVAVLMIARWNLRGRLGLLNTTPA